jgi:hypothetical protein
LSTDREKAAPFLPTQIYQMTDSTIQQRSYPCHQSSSIIIERCRPGQGIHEGEVPPTVVKQPLSYIQFAIVSFGLF